MIFVAYIISLLSVGLTIYFFKIWYSGKFLNVVLCSFMIRFMLIPVFEVYGSKIMPIEIPELIEWYEIWLKYGDLKSEFYILINPFFYEGSTGMYIYYTMFAGWFLNLTGTAEMIPLRIFTASLSLYLIVISVNFVKLIYKETLSTKHIFIIVNWPFWLYYSVTLGRTVPSVLIPLIGIIATYKLLQRVTFKYVLIVILTLWLTLIYRTFYTLFFLSTIASFFSYNFFFDGSNDLKLVKKGVIIFSVCVAFFLFFTFVNTDDIFKLITVGLASGDQVDGDMTGSSYLLDYFPEKYSDLWAYVSIHAIYFFMSPMIWDVHKIDQLVSCVVSMILPFLILKMTLSNNNKYNDNKTAKIFMLNMAIICMMLGAGVKNAGAAQRWRLPVTSIVLCITLIGISPKKQLD